MTTCFITGTGTDIGKTYVSAGLIRAFTRDGRRVTALKPVVSGFDPGAFSGSDPAMLIEAAGLTPTLEAIEAISPFRFHPPLSPDMAARAEGGTLDFDKIIAFCREAEARRQAEDVLLIEGVGGLMVPLDQQHTVLDWMVALNQPLILVTGSYLGAISHCLTALDVLERRGLTLVALVVNESAASTVPLDETLETLRCFTQAPRIVLRQETRHQETKNATKGSDVNVGAFAQLAKLVAEHKPLMP